MKPTVLLVSFSLPLFAIRLFRSQVSDLRRAYASGCCSGRAQGGFGLLRDSGPRSGEKCASELVSSTVLASSQSMLIAGLHSAARHAGQLQKAITYGEKALEMRGEDRKIQAACFALLIHLPLTYRPVRNFDKARELIEKGVAVVKEASS